METEAKVDTSVLREWYLQFLPERQITRERQARNLTWRFWPAAGGVRPASLCAAGEEAENPGEPEGRPEGEPGEEQVRSPSDPTTAEVEEHEATGHVQYRTWCKHCVAGRGIGQQHRTREEELRAQDGLPVIASDYTFMSQSGAEDGRAKPILVVKDS